MADLALQYLSTSMRPGHSLSGWDSYSATIGLFTLRGFSHYEAIGGFSGGFGFKSRLGLGYSRLISSDQQSYWLPIHAVPQPAAGRRTAERRAGGRCSCPEARGCCGVLPSPWTRPTGQGLDEVRAGIVPSRTPTTMHTAAMAFACGHIRRPSFPWSELKGQRGIWKVGMCYITEFFVR